MREARNELCVRHNASDYCFRAAKISRGRKKKKKEKKSERVSVSYKVVIENLHVRQHERVFMSERRHESQAEIRDRADRKKDRIKREARVRAASDEGI